MRTPFKLKSGNKTNFKNMGSSPAKQTKEVKGTSIFGMTPKTFLKEAQEKGIEIATLSPPGTIKKIKSKLKKVFKKKDSNRGAGANKAQKSMRTLQMQMPDKSSPAKQTAIGTGFGKMNPQDMIAAKIDEKVEEKVNKVVNQETGEGLV